jgi:fructose-bisphosphate aldolase class II
MRLTIAALFIVGANAFTPVFTSRRAVTPLNNMAEDVGIPCEDECALESFPNLPPSVHPGVLSGQAMMDLLDHAKNNGELVSLEALLLDIHASC